MSNRRAYFHEDDYGRIEVLPVENWYYCASQLGLIAKFYEQHRAPNGTGGTGMSVRHPQPTSLSTLAIPDAELSRRLAAHLLPFDRVETGHGTQIVECERTRAFGPDGDCAVFYSFDETGIVTKIWLGLGGPAPTEREMLLSAFRDVQGMRKLLLVDWPWERLFALDDFDVIAAYLLERERHMQGVYDRLDARRSREPPQPTKTKKPWWRFWG